MDWIKQNNFLAGYIGVMLVSVLGLGFFAFSSWKGYSAAYSEFETKQSAVSKLEKKSLHPNPDNVLKVEELAKAEEAEVDGLFAKIAAKHPPPHRHRQ